MLKFLHENGCPWDEDTCSFAARNVRLECLKYAHEHGCPWDRIWNRSTHSYHSASYWAAESGHLECLKYLHENECPWDEETCSNAAENNHLECLQYACDNKCPGSASYLPRLSLLLS